MDGIFGYVMSKPDNCLHLLRAIFPKRKIKWVKPIAIIFFFPFDPFGGEQLVYHAKMMIEEKHDRSFVSNMEILIFNSQGTKGHVSKDLKAFLDYMNGNFTKDNAFIAKLDKEIKEYTASPEWRQRKMNWAVKIADAKYEQRIESEKEDMKKTIKRARKWGITKQEIIDGLLQDYGNDFTKEEIEQIISKEI